MSEPRIAAVIMAAGKGTRLKSELPKVLHEVCGRPMLAYVFDACRAAGVERLIVVVGHGREQVVAAFEEGSEFRVQDGHCLRPERRSLSPTWVTQEPQLGTGHAVMVCREHLGDVDHVLVLGGDGPLIRAETVRELIQRHLENGAAATLATAVLDDPAGYGRIWRDRTGRIVGIVEHADATPEQRQIREVNPSYYCFRAADLLPALDKLQPNNAKHEYYITDTLAIFLQAGRPVDAITAVPPEDIYSINSRRELAQVNGIMRDRILRRLMDDGVTMVDPATTWIDARAMIGRDTSIYPMVSIDGPARIGANCRVGPFVHLAGAVDLPDGTTLAGYTALNATAGTAGGCGGQA